MKLDQAFIWLWLVPLAAFTVAMIAFPKYRAAIFAAEVASPIPPLP